ncbi:protein lin-54-like protein [Dinothrombium tinctorium]|uniref:Protein lin-54-like protein n=1 Tax=Dinothrombium tinctorium TaxID=1965070 RepID=A0A3S3PG39_9ACAR|nr:protein lin-54-like protein [Dinothrombium tinctorium]
MSNEITLEEEEMETEDGFITSLDSNRQDNVEVAEEVVLSDVANEVSITASIEKGASADSGSGAAGKTVRKTKSVLTQNKTKPIQPNQGSILIPVSNQASGLAQFITSIRPPAIPGSSIKMRPVVANTKLAPAKKPLAIAPAPAPVTSSGVIMSKVIMTTPTGQQLLISSPVKCQENQKSLASGAVNSTSQPIVLFSPIKPSTPNKLVQVRPKPVTTVTTPVTNSTQQKSEVKPLQIIRLVTLPSSSVSVSSSVQTSSKVTNKVATLSALSPNINNAQVVSTTSQKIVMAASTVKATTPNNSAGILQSSSQIPSAFITNSGGAPVIMLPAQFLQGQNQTISSVNQLQGKVNETSAGNVKHVTFATAPAVTAVQQRTSFVPIAPSPLTSQTATPSASQILAGLSGSKNAQNGSKSDGDANRPRKPCNCTKSQCLKLYCDCFANGEFCHSCNCINCANNLDHEEDRQKAIKQCLERNPHAFHPKIGKGRGDITERRHTKGCNCRRSGCLKNYCECYEAKILCSDLCKCNGCKNYEDSYERKTLMHLADAAEVRSAQQSVASKSKLWGNDFTAKLPIRLTGDRKDRLHCSFITPEVLEATCQCLLATAEEGERIKLSYQKIEEKILEEFGSCLSKIIETANKTRRN